MGIWCTDNRGNEILLKSTMVKQMLPYHYVGYYNPVPKLISVDFAELEKKIFNSYLNYSEVIKELWKFPERKHQMKNSDLKICGLGKTGWYISDGKNHYLHKDLKLHRNTGYLDCGQLEHGKAPGYYSSEYRAKYYLQKFKEKHNMENVEITVKVNGVATPLHKISEQTLLTVRENSKPKEVPVARVADSNGRKYLILKVPENIGNHIGRVVAINLKGNYINGSWTLKREQDASMGSDCVFSYKNVKTIE